MGFQAIDWASPKQNRVRHCSYGAEILACTDAAESLFHIYQLFKSIKRADEMQHILHVDASTLFDIISTWHNGN